MWTLRPRPQEHSVCCIPIDGHHPFTVGRIGTGMPRRNVPLIIPHDGLRVDCALNLAEDKSVSRKHAQLHLIDRNATLQLSDLNSKFGTWHNGERVVNDVELRHGDCVKFGGTQSEFIVERQELVVFVGALRNGEKRQMMQMLADRFGFETTEGESDARWNFVVFDAAIDAVTTTVLEGMAREASFVSHEYFSQLIDASTRFSLPLMQPVCSVFPVKCLLPRSGRRNGALFSTLLAGVRKLLCLQPRTVPLLNAMLRRYPEPLMINLYTRDIPMRFCDILVVDSSFAEVKDGELREAVRIVSAQSLIDAFVFDDESCIRMETFMPTVQKVSAASNSTSHASYVSQDTSFRDIVVSIPAKREAANPVLHPPSGEPGKTAAPSDAIRPEDDSRHGASLVCVLPISESLLRRSHPPAAETDASANGPRRFQKCHPLSHRPGAIPSLIGPDQLVPTDASKDAASRSNSKRASLQVDSSVSSRSVVPPPGPKRRVLVKDAWLAENRIEVETGEWESSPDEGQSHSFVLRVGAASAMKTEQTAPTAASAPVNIVSAGTPAASSSASLLDTSHNSRFQSSFFQSLGRK